MSPKTINIPEHIAALETRIAALEAVLRAAPPKQAISDQRYWSWSAERDRVLATSPAVHHAPR